MKMHLGKFVDQYSQIVEIIGVNPYGVHYSKKSGYDDGLCIDGNLLIDLSLPVQCHYQGQWVDCEVDMAFGKLVASIGDKIVFVAVENLRNKKRETFINLYPDGYCNCYSSKEEADRNALKDRVRCERIEW